MATETELLRDTILRALQLCGPLKTSELAARFGLPLWKVREVCLDMMREGALVLAA